MMTNDTNAAAVTVDPFLADIARKTGGQYFRATDAGALQRIFQQVDQLERTRMATRQPKALDERTVPFLVAGLGFVAVALLLGATRAVRAP